MKLIKVLDKEGEKLVADPTNTTILRELVTAEHSAAELAQKLKIPTLNVWRRMQKLQKAKLIEHTTTQKIGNLEKKLYRSTATCFTPQQYFNFIPKNPALTEAFELYNEIQKKMMSQTVAYDDIPKNTDPIDYAFFVNMMVFADVCSQQDVQTKIVTLKKKLANFNHNTELKI
jgi:predicted transcriptional regulator